MPDYMLNGKVIRLTAATAIGKGGEADIHVVGGHAIKIFKTQNHPDFTTNDERLAAAVRLALHQKKLPAFPRNLPDRVVTPEALVLDKRGGIAGYQMRFLSGAEVLFRYGERQFREQGATDEMVVRIFSDLHKTVEGIHRAHVVIGDFNDLNVLVSGTEAHIVDADSMQFGPFLTPVFTKTFADPLLCEQLGASLTLRDPHNAASDWYAYLVMLMRSLLYVGPHGGVYAPKDRTKLIAPDLRPLKHITVFDPEVRYPRPARPLSILPDALLDLFEGTFVKDARGMPPLSLIEGLRFTTCTKCGTRHARPTCPVCITITPPMVKMVHTGTVNAEKVFDTSGTILHAAMQNGTLRYVYHQDGYYREGGRLALRAARDPLIRIRTRGTDTLFARGTDARILSEDGRMERLTVDAYGQLPLLDANDQHVFFAQGGGLFRRQLLLGTPDYERVGDVLPNQTLFWVGDELGFGFFRAAELSNFFLFNPKRRGLNDSVKVPAIRGQLIDATAAIARDRVWFFTTTQEGGRRVNRCHVITASGTLLGSSEDDAGSDGWLGTIRGKAAAGDFLLAPTDDGIVRVAIVAGAIQVAATYPDTKRFVDAETNLFVGKDGVYAIGSQTIWRLTVKQNP